MKSEDFAQDIFLVENNKIPDFSNNRPGTDKRIYAFGYMSSVVGGGHGFSVEVFNHSDKTLATEKLFRDLTLVTYNGKRYDRSETEMMWSRNTLKPGESANFNFKFPGIRLSREELRMVICSFDMGRTTIILFPLTRPEKPAPAPKKATVEKPAPTPFSPGPIKTIQNFFQGMSERKAAEIPVSEPVPPRASVAVNNADKEVRPVYPLVRPDQVIEGVRYEFGPNFRKEVAESQRQVEQTVYEDREWSSQPRREAKVVVVNPEYGFVVIDAGFESGFGKNVILDVLRKGRRIAKVMITKPRDKISGAIILPEWRTGDDIRAGDAVGISR